MKTRLQSGGVLMLVVALWSVQALGQQHPSMPPDMTHEQHLAQMRRDAEMKQRGAVAMGFDQDAVVHHFLLTSTGGAIQVDVRNRADEDSLKAIRAHLRQIAAAFGDGQFEAPFVTHGEMPPGVSDLQRLKSTITYTFTETPDGGAVRIATTHGEAIRAVHEFLRYQIAEHHTGDPLTIAK